jgi:drug/metabolite transporter (DMT)-like permease
MYGYLLAILTGIFFGLQGTYGKVISAKYSARFATWATFTFSLPFVLVFLWYSGIPPIVWKDFLPATLVSFIINIFAWNLFYRALKSSSLSNTMPFTAFTPLFLIPVAFLWLGEIPDIKGIAGILFIILGAYGIHLQSRNLLEPFINLFKDKGSRLMLLVALIWSVSATAEKVAVLSSSQFFYGSVILLLLSLAYFPLILKERKEVALGKNLPNLFLLGLISGLLMVFQFTALKYLYASYVIAFKRSGIIVSVFLGVILFKEKNALKNIISSILMIVGVFLILI